jgi:hypothetical protein
LQAGHETLLWLVPTQGEHDFLTFRDSTERGFPHEFPVRLKKNRDKELLRASYFFEHQERVHFQVMTCTAFSIFQGVLSRASGWDLGWLENGTGRPNYNFPLLARLVHPNNKRLEGTGKVHGAETAGDQREAAGAPIAVVVQADDFFLRSYRNVGEETQTEDQGAQPT